MNQSAKTLGVSIPEILRKLENHAVTDAAKFPEANAEAVVVSFLRDRFGESTLTKAELALVLLAGARALRGLPLFEEPK